MPCETRNTDIISSQAQGVLRKEKVVDESGEKKKKLMGPDPPSDLFSLVSRQRSIVYGDTD